MPIFPRPSTILFTLGGAALLSLAAPQSAHAGNFTKITDSVVKINGVKYFRTKAEDALLGSVGVKMEPATQKNYFKRVREAPSGIFKVRTTRPYTITTQEANQLNIKAAASNVQGKVSGGIGTKGKYKGKLTAYKMEIEIGNDKGDLRFETNRNHKHLEAFKNEGNKARLISQVWILVEGQENKSSCYAGDLSVDANGTASVKVSGSGCTKSSWVIPPGSIMAYEMVRADEWDNKEIVKDVECPSSHPKPDVRNSPVHPMDRCIKTTYETTGIECKLLVTDKAKNWYVQSKDGKDVCKSKKGKPNKSVKCKKSGYDYKVKTGKDECTKPKESYKDPFCPAGYDYDKKTSDGGKDKCNLRGIQHLKVDGMEGW